MHQEFGVRVEKSGTRFRLFAPGAIKAAVILKENIYGDEETRPMKSVSQGVWELNIPNRLTDWVYQYEITSQIGTRRKADYISFSTVQFPAPFEHDTGLQFPPNPLAKTKSQATRIVGQTSFKWTDADWILQRAKKQAESRPLNIYKLYLYSWVKENGNPLNYKDLAKKIAAHCKQIGYTHVEFMGLLEYPDPLSMGYQVSNYFAPSCHHGTPDDFKWMVNYLHVNGIGCILDFIPAHTAVDGFGLGKWDGTTLFESNNHPIHPEWKTYVFDFEKEFVRDYFLSSIEYWIAEMHIDIIRFDAVSDLLFLDRGKENGKHPWTPSAKGNNHHYAGRRFLREVNTYIHKNHPGVVTIAEDPSEHPKTTLSLEKKGWGFDLRWGFSSLHSLLNMLKTPYEQRPSHFQKVIDCIHLALDRNIILSLSHDEVDEARGSLYDKMPGDDWKRFANMRLLTSFIMALPPGKLFAMGSELGQSEPWDKRVRESIYYEEKRNLTAPQWEALQPEHPHASFHKGIYEMTSKINQLYLSEPSLWPHSQNGPLPEFKWIHTDYKNCVVSFYRNAPGGKELICVHNFGAEALESYEISFPISSYFPYAQGIRKVKEIFNSDENYFGGSGVINTQIPLIRSAHLPDPSGIQIRLAPLASMLFELRRK